MTGKSVAKVIGALLVIVGIMGATMDTGGLGSIMIVVVDEKTANTAGGTFTAGAWQTRTLNTLRVNDNATASLDSDQVTLPAGTYECWILAPAFSVERHKIRLQDTTGTATLVMGLSNNASSGGNESNVSILYGKFTISVSSALEVQHRCGTTKSSNGFGLQSNFGVVEVYTTAVFRKVD